MYLHGACFTVAFLAMSFVHVVIGEVVPKNLALDKADRLALLVAPVLLIFYRISAPFVFVVERTSAGLSRALGLKGHGGGGHSAEELKFILESSRREGHLETFEEDAIQKLLGLKEIYAREIMTPRIDIVSVSADASLDELLRITLEHKYSRVPVYEGKPEHIIGFVHYKDLVRVWRERKNATDRRQPAIPFRLRRYLREVLVVPETKPLNQLVDEFREHHTHLAMVVDEFGTITGMVTLEDVLEQIFGEIGDEHDVRRPLPVAGALVIEVDGGTSIRDLVFAVRDRAAGRRRFRDPGRVSAVPPGLHSGARRFRDARIAHVYRSGNGSQPHRQGEDRHPAAGGDARSVLLSCGLSGDLRQQLPHGSLQHRMPQIRRQFRQRRQHKPSLRHARMRDLQLRRFHHRVPIQQNVEVDQPRPFGRSFHPPHLALDALEVLEQLPRKQVGLDFDHLVQKPGLVEDIARLGFPDRRLCASRAPVRRSDARMASARFAWRSPRFDPSPRYAIFI